MISSNICVPTTNGALYFPLNLVTQNAGSISKLRLLQERYLCNRYKSNTYYTWYSSYTVCTTHYIIVSPNKHTHALSLSLSTCILSRAFSAEQRTGHSLSQTDGTTSYRNSLILQFSGKMCAHTRPECKWVYTGMLLIPGMFQDTLQHGFTDHSL